jgi:hypothetical protein
VLRLKIYIRRAEGILSDQNINPDGGKYRKKKKKNVENVPKAQRTS